MIDISRWAMIMALGGLAWAGEKYTKEQLSARFHYDLGPAEVDVSSYPKKQQQNYQVFKRTCSQCHSLARPINSPLAKREDWGRYVRRMHLHTKVRAGTQISKEEAGAIVDFLAYDSKRRKLDQKPDFEARDLELRALFEEVKKERMRIQVEEDKSKVKPMPPAGAGERPQP